VENGGNDGYKLVTDGVVDYLGTDDSAPQQKYILTSFCTLDNVTDFKLDPQGRAKNQAALIQVTKSIDVATDSAEQPLKSFLFDDVQLLTSAEAEALKPILKKRLYFAMLAGQVSRKRPREAWSPVENPTKAPSCKILSRSPTGPQLPDYSFLGI
jgi:hypothetical protein